MRKPLLGLVQNDAVEVGSMLFSAVWGVVLLPICSH
jgi:hypothetical protein